MRNSSDLMGSTAAASIATVVPATTTAQEGVRSHKRRGSELSIDAIATIEPLKAASFTARPLSCYKKSKSPRCTSSPNLNTSGSQESGDCSVGTRLEKHQIGALFPSSPCAETNSASDGKQQEKENFECDSAMLSKQRQETVEAVEPNGCSCFGGLMKGFLRKRSSKVKNRPSPGSGDDGCSRPIVRLDCSDSLNKSQSSTPSQGLDTAFCGPSLSCSNGGFEQVGKPLPTQRHHRKASMQRRINTIESYLAGATSDQMQISSLHRRCVSWDTSMDSVSVGINSRGSAKSLHGGCGDRQMQARSRATRAEARSRSRSRSRSVSNSISSLQRLGHGHPRTCSEVNRPMARLIAEVNSDKTQPQGSAKVRAHRLSSDQESARSKFLLRVSPIREEEVK